MELKKQLAWRKRRNELFFDTIQDAKDAWMSWQEISEIIWLSRDLLYFYRKEKRVANGKLEIYLTKLWIWAK